jgi:hypothetical protein
MASPSMELSRGLVIPVEAPKFNQPVGTPRHQPLAIPRKCHGVDAVGIRAPQPENFRAVLTPTPGREPQKQQCQMDQPAFQQTSFIIFGGE